MFPCTLPGCGNWFESAYGLRVHLRSCSYVVTDVPGNGPKRRTPSSTCEIIPGSIIRDKQFATKIVSEEEVDSVTDELINLPTSQRVSFISDGSDEVDEDKKLETLLMLELERLGRRTSKKDAGKIIDILSNPSFNSTNFGLRCRSYRDCVEEQERQSETMLGALGFKKMEVIDPESQYRCHIYAGSPITVLQEQISNAKAPSTIFNREECPLHEQYSHPMTSDLGVSAVYAVRNEIMLRSGSNVMWHNRNASFESSFVGLVQLYSDKSQSSLKVSSFHFYPLHITLLNFSTAYRRKCIVDGNTFLAFLPVEFFLSTDVESLEMDQEKFGRSQRIRLLHVAVELALNDLKLVAYRGFKCRDEEGTMRRCHPCIFSYCSDLPEAKDLLPVRNGNQGTRNCHRCMAETVNFNRYTTSRLRSGKETVSLMEEATLLRRSGRRAASEALLKKYSLADHIPILNVFPFIVSDPSLDIHSIYMVEPLHEFHLGISKDLKRCASERLRSEILFTSALPTNTNIIRRTTLKSVRMAILNGLNKMLAHIQKTSPMHGLRIDFSKTDKGTHGNGLFNGEGKLMGMLEGKDYKSLDMISPFMGMLLDRCSDEILEAPTTNVFVEYVDIMQTALSYDNQKAWNIQRIQQMERSIARFKNDTRMLYQHHHPSRFCTEKMHMLDHIPYDLQRAGGLQYGDAGLFEYSHTLVKGAYRCGSKRKSNSIDETLTLFQKEMSYGKLYKTSSEIERKGPQNDIHPKRRRLNSEVTKNDCAALVNKGKSIVFTDFRKARSCIRKLRKASQRSDVNQSKRLSKFLESLHKDSLELAYDVGEDGSRILQRQLLDMRDITGESGIGSVDYSISRLSSCYVPGTTTPTLKDYNEETNEISLPHSSIRESERVVSERNFHGTPGLRQDCVLIQGTAEQSNTDPVLWVGKCLALLRLKRTSPTAIPKEPGDDEYIFVQYFDVMPPQDFVDKKLGCVRLQWATDGTGDMFTRDQQRKWFDLLPVSTIRGRVHVIRGDYGMDGLGVTKDIEEVPWHDRFFYINRFYFDTSRRHSSLANKKVDKLGKLACRV